MQKSFSCPRGHQWAVTLADGGPAFLPGVACPVCGGPAATVGPGNDVPPGDTSLTDTPAAAPTGVPTAWAAQIGLDILGELGRGGMGVVYQARQIALNRTVALKLLPGGLLAGPERLARFRAEAEAVARLQHPNIVQVFEFGEWQGQPYLVLEYVDGGDLAAWAGGRPQPARVAAELVETLAEAMASAHSRGVVHRDLKPANILLAACGLAGTPAKPQAAKITDFGLAKELDAAAAQTRSGTPLGTPSYMAPEQAEGRTDVGPAADVWALGAVLYELLTGRPPFQAATVLETLEQVRSDEPVPPRRLVPRLPRDLETVALKCLQKEPAKRYGSAEALADDLRRFLDGRPITARPVGPVDRLARWCRRRPALAGLSAALIVVAVGSLVSLTWAWRVAVKERARAVQNLNDARSAVRRHFTLLSEVRLGKDPAARPLRRQLLEDALAYFETFREQHGDDPRLRADVADAAFRVAVIHADLGARDRAAAEFDRARGLYEGLLPDSPDPLLRERLAACCNNLGVMQAETGRADDALRSLGRSLALREFLAEAPAAGPVARCDLATTHVSLGNLHARLRRAAEAQAAYEWAIELLGPLAREHPDRPEFAATLAAAYSNLGVLHLEQTGRADEALNCHQRALALREALAEAHPAAAEYLDGVASSFNNLAVVHLERTGRADEALRCLTEALSRREKLARDSPAVAEYQSHLADTLNNLGLLHARQGRKEEALRCHRQALAVRERLAAGDSAVVSFQRTRAASLHNIGLLLAELGRTAESLAAHRQALAIRRQLTTDHPGDPALQADAAASECEVGRN